MKDIKDIILEVSPYYAKKGEPEAEHTLLYDSAAETLEPVYFFILDLLQNLGFEPEKLVDNFTSTPGGSHFSEVGMKATRLQEEASKLLANVNTVLRSVLNIVYDLKEFKIRLEHYDALHDGNRDEKEAAILSLKQIWMDKVDIAKGNSSIKAMALGQMGYQTLIDAFLIAKTPKDVDEMDLNDRVQRILKPRVQEFNNWIDQSEKELRKRFELEKTYLRSQVASLKLYSRWVKPYLKAAEQLKMKDRDRSPELVGMFNTVLFELSLFGKRKIDVHDAALDGDLPLEFQKMKVKRDYYSVVLTDFTFRAIPRQQGVLVGRTNVAFRAYALNDDEINKINEEINKSDIGDVLGLIEGATTESLDVLQSEIDEFLEDDSKSSLRNKSRDESNPFLALIGWYDKSEKPKPKSSGDGKPKITGPVRKDDWIEKTHLRTYAAADAKKVSFDIFDIYKKAHGMASYT